MNTSKDSIILIEDESSCGSFCSNCKELIATTKRKRMEKELRAMRNNMYIGDSDDIENNNHSSESDNDNDDVDNDDTRESYSSKRARWYQEDMERNDCLTTIWKMDDKLVRLITHGTEEMPDSPDLEYTPASPELENSNDSEESYGAAGEELVRFLTHGLNNRSSSPNNSITSEESYSAKRARWHQEDLERNDCLQTIWKMDERMERLLTQGPNDMPASPDCEYSPASPEYEIPASPTNESIGKTPDSSPKSLAKAWCYACDDDFDF